FACLLVTFVAVAPLITLWPLRVLFLAARPAMESLADQASTGQPFKGPRWIGVFRLSDATVDSATGDVTLLFAPRPNGRTWFVRRAANRTLDEPPLFNLDPYPIDLGL